MSDPRHFLGSKGHPALIQFPSVRRSMRRTFGSLKHAGQSTADGGNAYVRSLDLEPDGPLTSVNGCGGKDATIQKTPARDVFGQVAAEQ